MSGGPVEHRSHHSWYVAAQSLSLSLQGVGDQKRYSAPTLLLDNNGSLIALLQSAVSPLRERLRSLEACDHQFETVMIGSDVAQYRCIDNLHS